MSSAKNYLYDGAKYIIIFLIVQTHCPRLQTAFFCVIIFRKRVRKIRRYGLFFY